MIHVQTKDSFEFYATEHFRMSGVYWGLTAMHLLGKQHMMDTAAITDWVLSCQHANGGFGGSERHDPHLLYTLSAVQILALCGALDRINREQVAQCAPSQLPLPLHVPKRSSCLGTSRSNHTKPLHGPVTLQSQHAVPCADVRSLQQPDGSFAGDDWGEIDTR